MLVIYNIGIRLYFSFIFVASFFNKKAALWLKGRKKQILRNNGPSIWFHFASLGEFEQGRPVLEQMKALHPGKKIVVSFFSPSGYEIRKNSPLADVVYYLPLDTPNNARDFIKAVQPSIAIFTKYEYWFHFYNELHNRRVPLYIISGIFRPKQVFFKWYGSLHRKMLKFVSHFFVQDERSKQLLQNIGITNVSISGDTRFDRVWANAQQPKMLPQINKFKNGNKLFIAGSTWPPDEQLLTGLINDYPDWKFIIAPHEISDEKINKLMSLLPAEKTIKYSALEGSEPSLFKILVIDNIGMLSSLYQYGEIAYIGGGFGVGIHNTLEAAAFGLPVIFGPEYDKFKEAKDLVNNGGGFSISNEAELKAVAVKLINDDAFFNTASKTVKNYVEEHTGATPAIIAYISNNDLS